jgi:chromosome segregation ATPase
MTGSALALALTLVAPAALAARAAHAAPPPRPAPAPKNTAAAEQTKQINAAQATVNEIKADQKRLKDKLTTEFESKEEWKNTAANFKKAQTAYDKAKKDAMRTLAAKPEYKKLLAEKDAARTKVDELNKQREPDPTAIAKAGTDLATKSTALKKLEADAVANDEKVLAAKEAFEVADKEMKALDAEVEGALTSDPDYVAVQQQLDQAEAQVKQLRDAAAAARKQDQQSKAAASRAASAAKTTSTPRRSRGGEGQ